MSQQGERIDREITYRNDHIDFLRACGKNSLYSFLDTIKNYRYDKITEHFYFPCSIVYADKLINKIKGNNDT